MTDLSLQTPAGDSAAARPTPTLEPISARSTTTFEPTFAKPTPTLEPTFAKEGARKMRGRESSMRRSLAASTAEGVAAEVVQACAGSAMATAWALHLRSGPLLL